MKRKTLAEKKASGYFEGVRFFSFLPKEVADDLSVENKRAIARTILELQKNNPRILKEIYLEQPDKDKARLGFFIRLKRRVALMIRIFVFEMLLQKSERRFGASLADYAFLLIVIAMLFTAVVTVVFILYGVKNIIGIDIFPGIHFFYVD